MEIAMMMTMVAKATAARLGRVVSGDARGGPRRWPWSCDPGGESRGAIKRRPVGEGVRERRKGRKEVIQ